MPGTKSKRKAGKPTAARRRLSGYLVMPTCLLLLNAIEEVVIYKLQNGGINKLMLTLVLVLMFAIGFSFVGDILVPHIKAFMEKAHHGSRKHTGELGLLAFYATLCGLMFLLYFIIYVKGPQFLLPPTWR